MDFRTAAIIPAAGLSTRMGDFKPLMELGGEPLIRRSVRSALAGGARSALVVLGREAERVRAALAELPAVIFVENPRYAESDMLYSVRLGLRALAEATVALTPDAVFILPADMPAIAPATFELLARRAIEPDSAPLLRPLCGGGHGHPLLVRREAFAAILGFPDDGAGGLKAALAGFIMEGLECADEGVLLDADTPEDLERLREYLS